MLVGFALTVNFCLVKNLIIPSAIRQSLNRDKEEKRVNRDEYPNDEGWSQISMIGFKKELEI